MPRSTKSKIDVRGIEKAPTGIIGLDQITFGGIPRGRPTLICGNAGCGKTLMAMEIIIRGAVEFKEPGVFFSFEEHKEDLVRNVASMGFDLAELEQKKLVQIHYVDVDMKGYLETGDYNLDGLFIRIESAVQKIGAKRIALDTLEVLFSGFHNEALLRAELRRLFSWLKERQLTAILTGEEGTEIGLTRYGIEEYVADCVIALTNTVIDDLYTRRLHIIKYRGSRHETNRFPFVIGHNGILILPITSAQMKSVVSFKKISTGIPKLDDSLDGEGYYEGSSILLSGSSGSGKTTFAAAFALSICQKKRRCLFISYEQSEAEILRNAAEINLDFKSTIQEGYFKIISTRPTQWGLESHLGNFLQDIEEFKPDAVIIDPISTLSHCGTSNQVYSVMTRMIDFLKNQKITFLMTLFSTKQRNADFTDSLTSLIDTWIHLRNEETNGELNRDLLIIKSRGMKHSNQVREFSISAEGIDVAEPYYGEAGVLTGTARVVQEAKDEIVKMTGLITLEQLRQEISLKQKLIDAQVKSLYAELEAKQREAQKQEEFLNFKEAIAEHTKEKIKKARLSSHPKERKHNRHDKKSQ